MYLARNKETGKFCRVPFMVGDEDTDEEVDAFQFSSLHSVRAFCQTHVGSKYEVYEPSKKSSFLVAVFGQDEGRVSIKSLIYESPEWPRAKEVLEYAKEKMRQENLSILAISQVPEKFYK